MSGRGGFKATTSLRPEQLQGMGITGKDMPSSTIAPPPTFPPLPNKPAALEKTDERDYMIDWKERFLTYLKESPYYTGAVQSQLRTHHHRFHYENANANSDAFAWNFMPAELKPNWKRKAAIKENQSKVAKVVNVEETLKALEQKEIQHKRMKTDTTVIKEEEKDSENENQEHAEDEEEDDEMDEDNDYGFNYFDNGDDYNDEDDNLDDGPIY